MTASTVETLAKFSTQKCAGKFAVASAGPRVVAGYDVDIGKKVSINGSAPRQITSRTSYVIAPDGKIIYAHSDSEPEGQLSGPLAAVQAWRGKHPSQGRGRDGKGGGSAGRMWGAPVNEKNHHDK